MANCKDCLHADVCWQVWSFGMDASAVTCKDFKEKSLFVEVDVIRKWLYQIAMNNVGSPSLLSASCVEIISRLDGLVTYARERKTNETD